MGNASFFIRGMNTPDAKHTGKSGEFACGSQSFLRRKIFPETFHSRPRPRA